MCLGYWSALNMVKTEQVAKALKHVGEADGGAIEELFKDGWDATD
jgi:hypothetical protein